MSKRARLVLEALQQPLPAISFFVTENLTRLHPEREVFAVKASRFNLVGYAEVTKECKVAAADDVPLDTVRGWRSADRCLSHSYLNGYYLIEWRGHKLEALHLTWPDGKFGTIERAWIVADSKEIARDFYRTVLSWATEVRGEVLVFHGGCWKKGRELFEDISKYSRDNLVLGDDLKTIIWDDFSQFFAARELYQTHGIPWKRGVLFTGPPGNGKSHTVKALINEMGIPCLYVKSLEDQYGNEHSNIRDVFKRARDTTPCILVFEDLDSHVHDKNRSFFLNEMDGFAANEGILTLATCNYPERLDPAILERPSRFDRKYQFNLPQQAERMAYLGLWNERLEKDLRLDMEQLSKLAVATDGFSFAYLRELVLSSMMAWIHRQTDMPAIMKAQLVTLSMQMKSGVAAQAQLSANSGGDSKVEAAMKRLRR